VLRDFYHQRQEGRKNLVKNYITNHHATLVRVALHVEINLHPYRTHKYNLKNFGNLFVFISDSTNISF